MPTIEPQQMSHEDRQALADEIIAQIQERYGNGILALGIYGSLGRGSDGPFSDIEIMCVLKHPQTEESVEWCAGPWKAEVNLYSLAAVEEWAQRLDDHWPLTHGVIAQIRPIFDPDDIFPRLQKLAFADRSELVRAEIESILVGELYEIVGKLRNARVSGVMVGVVPLVVEFAEMTAMAIGLANQHCYTTGTCVLTEACTLADRPAGFDALVQWIGTGQLSDFSQILAACTVLWIGIVAWAEKHNWQIVSAERIPI